MKSMKNHYSKSEYKNRKKKLQKNYSYIEMCKTMNNSKNFSKTFSNSFGHTKSKPKLSNTINKNTPSTPLNPFSTFGNGDLFRNCSAIKNKLSLSLHKISGNKMYENNTLFNNDKKKLKITNKILVFKLHIPLIIVKVGMKISIKKILFRKTIIISMLVYIKKKKRKRKIILNIIIM